MKAPAYYNEFDPTAAAWLRELIAEGHIAHGIVDERSIEDVLPRDLDGFTQCHFFAGIGGWSLALRLAGWPDDRPVWTGSCPCQPFSAAGAGRGTSDERHLWPAWHHLIRECSPPVVFGEQVEKAIRHGWLDLVRDDLEACGYAFGCAGLPAACVGAPHIRQRLWFVAHHDSRGRSVRESGLKAVGYRPAVAASGGADVLGHSTRDGLRVGGRTQSNIAHEPGDGPLHHWSNAEWIACRDGRSRPVEPGIQPLAHGVSGRVGLLRGAGNAIVPQVAAAFIEASGVTADLIASLRTAA